MSGQSITQASCSKMHLEKADATLDREVSEASACPPEGSTELVEFSIFRLGAEASLMRYVCWS